MGSLFAILTVAIGIRYQSPLFANLEKTNLNNIEQLLVTNLNERRRQTNLQNVLH